MQSYHFTDDDRMQPIYCIGCRKHIPRALSNQNSGYCQVCDIPPPPPPASPDPTPITDAWKWITRKPVIAPPICCARCGSMNCREEIDRDNTARNIMSAFSLITLALSCCLWPLIFVFLLLFFFALFIPTSIRRAERVCYACGFVQRLRV